MEYLKSIDLERSKRAYCAYLEKLESYNNNGIFFIPEHGILTPEEIEKVNSIIVDLITLIERESCNS